MDLELSAFLHFSITTFATGATGQHDCYNTSAQPGPRALITCDPPWQFRPTAVNTEQWLRTVAAMGARQACLTVHEEGGFALWPSAQTNYSLEASPFRGHDIVRSFVTSCRAHGVSPCFYFPASANGHHLVLGLSAAEFVAREKAMLTELLTRYGQIDRLCASRPTAFPRACRRCSLASTLADGVEMWQGWRATGDRRATASPTRHPHASRPSARSTCPLAGWRLRGTSRPSRPRLCSRKCS